MTNPAPTLLIPRFEAVLSRMLEWIRTVDQKATLIIGFSMALLGGLAAVYGGASKDGVEDHLLGLAGALPLCASLACCALATFPRVDGPEKSVIYFGAVARVLPGEYAQKGKAQSEEDYLDDLISQCHRNAGIAQVKYTWIRWAMMLLLGGSIPWGIAIVCLST